MHSYFFSPSQKNAKRQTLLAAAALLNLAEEQVKTLSETETSNPEIARKIETFKQEILAAIQKERSLTLSKHESTGYVERMFSSLQTQAGTLFSEFPQRIANDETQPISQKIQDQLMNVNTYEREEMALMLQPWKIAYIASCCMTWMLPLLLVCAIVPVDMLLPFFIVALIVVSLTVYSLNQHGYHASMATYWVGEPSDTSDLEDITTVDDLKTILTSSSSLS